jgi:hypothetical protein
MSALISAYGIARVLHAARETTSDTRVDSVWDDLTSAPTHDSRTSFAGSGYRSSS